MDTRVMVFGPGPVLTVTVELRHGDPDIHLHAGGQGVWQARMISALGAPVVLCANVGGETGQVLRHLIANDGVALRAAEGPSRNGAYVHDRRTGDRVTVADAPGDPLSRHELDELYNLALVEGLDAGVCVLAGPMDQRLIADEVYRRLAADLAANGRTVVADLSAGLLESVLDGGVQVLKVSHEELISDGRARSEAVDDLVEAVDALHKAGAETVVVSRAHEPALVSVSGETFEVVTPKLETVDPRGAGDSMTAGIAVGLSRGEPIEAAISLGAAAGALNVTRSGLGTGEGEAVERLAAKIELRPVAERRSGRRAVHASPDELARRTGL
jgi:1-phosphofructokinase